MDRVTWLLLLLILPIKAGGKAKHQGLGAEVYQTDALCSKRTHKGEEPCRSSLIVWIPMATASNFLRFRVRSWFKEEWVGHWRMQAIVDDAVNGKRDE